MELQAISYRHPDGLETSMQSEMSFLYLQVAIISKTYFYLCVPILFMVLVTDVLTDVHVKAWVFSFWKNHCSYKLI